MSLKNIVRFSWFAGLLALTAGSAHADGYMAPKGATAPMLTVSNWTGFYAGAHGGYAWNGDSTAFFTANDPYSTALLNGTLGFPGQAVGPVSFDTNGAFGGVQAGYNWQINRSWVAGVETDFSWSDIDGDGSTTALLSPPSLTATFNVRQDVQRFGTLRGRLGWLATDQWLIYATGGLAYGRIKESLDVTTAGTFGAIFTGIGGFGAFCYSGVFLGQCFATSSSRTEWGWTAGAGSEFALTRNITFKAEYLFVDLGSGDAFDATTLHPNFTGDAPTSIRVHTDDVNFHTVRAGINYRF